MPRFLRDYGYWVVIGVVVVGLLGVQVFLVAPTQSEAEEYKSKITRLEGQFKSMRTAKVYNQKQADAFKQAIDEIKMKESLVKTYVNAQKQEFFNDWPKPETEEWGLKFVDGTSSYTDRIRYRKLYPDFAREMYNEALVPLLPESERRVAEDLTEAGHVASFMRVAQWGTSEPTNVDIVAANTEVNMTRAFAGILLDAREKDPGLYEQVTFKLDLLGPGGLATRSRARTGGMMPGADYGYGGPTEYGPGAPGMGGPMGGGPGYDPAMMQPGMGGPMEGGRGYDPAMMQPGMAGAPPQRELVRTKKEESRPPGRLEYSDSKTKKYIYVFSLHTVMDWRKVGVLIGRICEAPGFDGKVETLVWQRVEQAPADFEVPLVDVQMSGLVSVSWDPEKGRVAPKPDERAGSTKPQGTRER